MTHATEIDYNKSVNVSNRVHNGNGYAVDYVTVTHDNGLRDAYYLLRVDGLPKAIYPSKQDAIEASRNRV